MSEQLTFGQLYNKSVGLLNEKRLAEAFEFDSPSCRQNG